MKALLWFAIEANACVWAALALRAADDTAWAALKVAAKADRVLFMVAGLPLQVK